MRNLLVVLAVAISALLIARPGLAQGSSDPARSTVSAGYAFLRAPDVNLATGFFADAGVRIMDNGQLVGEIAYHRKTLDEFGVSATVSQTSFLGGFRAIGGSESLNGFFQSLLGVSRISGGTSGQGFSVSVSTNAFTWEAGGGVIVPLNDRAGVRVGADYQLIVGTLLDETYTDSQFKILAGITFAVGD